MKKEGKVEWKEGEIYLQKIEKERKKERSTTLCITTLC